MNTTSVWFRVVAYRLGQVRQQLGFVAPLSAEDRREVQRELPASALSLFDTMSNADQQHSLRVYRSLQERGCIEHDMLAAALLHDVGKAQGRVPFWTRPVIVLGKLCAPRLLAQIVVEPSQIGPSVVHGQCSCERNQGTRKGMPLPDDGTLQVRSGMGGASPCGCPGPSQWRRSLSYAWWHADVGADLAAEASLSERAVLYIRTHHQPNGPAAMLHAVDEVS